MKYNYLMILVTLFTSVFTGCTTYLAESSFKPENVQVSKRTESKQPYRIENVYVGGMNNPFKSIEIHDQNTGKSKFLRKLFNFDENLQALKEGHQEVFETEKMYAADLFGVDESKVSLQMVGFMNALIMPKSEFELSEMCLPKNKSEKEFELTEEQRNMYSLFSSEVFKFWFGATAADPDMLNDYLSEQYPELFSENGKPINVAVIIADAPYNKIGQYFKDEQHYFDFGVWVWGANTKSSANECYPLPTSYFSAINRYISSTSLPTVLSFAGPISDNTEYVKVNDIQEVESFMIKRFAASIVDALNNLPKEQFDNIQ